MNPETRLTNRIRDSILAHYPDAWVTKVAGGPYQAAGIPDLLVLVHGHLFGFEVKNRRHTESEQAARGRATIRQQIQIDRINRAGGTALVILSPEEALDAISRGIGKNPHNPL